MLIWEFWTCCFRNSQKKQLIYQKFPRIQPLLLHFWEILIWVNNPQPFPFFLGTWMNPILFLRFSPRYTSYTQNSHHLKARLRVLLFFFPTICSLKNLMDDTADGWKKSGKLTSWGNGSDYPIIHRVLAPSQVVVWDFWTINSMI